MFRVGQERLEDPAEVVNHVIVSDADDAITEPVFGAFPVSAAVELDYQAPLPADAPPSPRAFTATAWAVRGIRC